MKHERCGCIFSKPWLVTTLQSQRLLETKWLVDCYQEPSRPKGPLFIRPKGTYSTRCHTPLGQVVGEVGNVPVVQNPHRVGPSMASGAMESFWQPCEARRRAPNIIHFRKKKMALESSKLRQKLKQTYVTCFNNISFAWSRNQQPSGMFGQRQFCFDP